MILIVGLGVMLACLALQALALALGAHELARIASRSAGSSLWRSVFLQLSLAMIVLMLGNVLQIALWALLYRSVGAFPDFETALYFSGVTFTTLGYGDVLLTGRVRLLGPLEAANGVMMFGITTAAFISLAQRVITEGEARSAHAAPTERQRGIEPP